MISMLRGCPWKIYSDRVIVDVSGVGYELFCSSNTLQDFIANERVEVFVHTHVREDALHLFGFSTENEKSLFLSLIKVNGVGPKLAITMLSGARISQIVEWIETDDVKALTCLPKVGKKTAEQMILSLKGQLVQGEERVPHNHSQREQIVSALVNLGYRLSDVEKISSEFEEAKTVQDGVRIGLQSLSKKLLDEL